MAKYLSDSPELAQAYESALVELGAKEGTNTSVLVRAVIYLKQHLTKMDVELGSLPIPDDVREDILKSMTHAVSDSVATMCTLMNKDFKADIQPLVEKVQKQVISAARKHLQ